MALTCKHHSSESFNYVVNKPWTPFYSIFSEPIYLCHCKFLCLCAGEWRGQRYDVFRLPVHPSVVHPSHFCGHDISGTPWGNFLKFYKKVHFFHRLKEELIRFWQSKVKVTVTSHPSHCHECKKGISCDETHQWNVSILCKKKKPLSKDSMFLTGNYFLKSHM